MTTNSFPSDITCGKEKIPIPCINEVDDVAAPLDFVYVKESFESSYLCINRNMNVVKVRPDFLLEMLNIRFQALSPQVVKIRPVGTGLNEI